MIVVFGDLLADLSIRLESFPLEAGEMQRSPFVDLGPGGAGNVAIGCRRFGLEVSCIGEIGDDELGEIVRRGLAAEGIDVRHLAVSPGARTPLAGVLVDEAGEPAYIGFPGTLRIGSLRKDWDLAIESAQAVFTDGWAEHEGVARMVLDLLRRARRKGVPTFFDPGPGNPALDNKWHRDAIGESRVLLLNREEAGRLTGFDSPRESAEALGKMGPELVIVKLGADGCRVHRGAESVELSAVPVPVVDTTGAGDSLDAAVIYGYLSGMELQSLAVLANAAGAAKVQKRGTGRNVPTLADIRAVLKRSGADPEAVLPELPG